MQYNKDHIKQLIGQNRLDEAVDALLELTNKYLSANRNDKFVAKISDALLINSGKLNGLIHDENLGILSPEEKKITRSEVNRAILYVTDQLPDTVFQQKNLQGFQNLESSETTEQTDLRNGVKLLHTDKQQFEYDIFLSFSSKDCDEARQVWEKLRGYGLRVFLSDEALKINIGTSFFEKINYGLAHSKHLVWLCTPQAVQSKYVRLETETFFNQFFEGDRRLIILKGKEFSFDLLLPIYRSLQAADNAKQIVHALIDKAKQLKIENEKLKTEQEAADKKRLAELEAQRQREREALEQKALDEFEHKQKEKTGEIIWNTDNKTGYFIDQRDQHQYKVVKIGTQVWMAENLAYTGKNGKQRQITDLNEWKNNNKYDGWCYYNNEPANGEKYGVLYQHEPQKMPAPQVGNYQAMRSGLNLKII